MLQPGGDLDLAKEPLGAEHVCQLGPEDLDGHLAVMFEVGARYTVAMPPCPSSRSIRYRSASAVVVRRPGDEHAERFLWRVRCGDGQEDIQMQTVCQRRAGIVGLLK